MMETHEYSKTIQILINPQFKDWFRNTVKRGNMKKKFKQKEKILKNILQILKENFV